MVFAVCVTVIALTGGGALWWVILERPISDWLFNRRNKRWEAEAERQRKARERHEGKHLGAGWIAHQEKRKVYSKKGYL